MSACSIIPSALKHDPSPSLIFTHFFTHTPLLDLINYISLVALETEVRECGERKLRDFNKGKNERMRAKEKGSKKQKGSKTAGKKV